jgi:hypothetical protein
MRQSITLIKTSAKQGSGIFERGSESALNGVASFDRFLRDVVPMNDLFPPFLFYRQQYSFWLSGRILAEIQNVYEGELREGTGGEIVRFSIPLGEETIAEKAAALRLRTTNLEELELVDLVILGVQSWVDLGIACEFLIFRRVFGASLTIDEVRNMMTPS